MIKLVKRNKTIDLKTKIVNSLMVSGEKKTGEKILLKFVKLLQKSMNKNFKSLIQLSIISSTPTFKLNEQVIKKGKRKATKITPSFIPNDSLRVTASLKFIKNVASKNKGSINFYESLVKEILASAHLKSQSVDKKNELQNQILMNKRYLSKFRW
jgi:ribosomal protein S7